MRSVNIVDIGCLDSGRYSLRNLVTAVLVRDLFRKRRLDRQREELGLPTKIPKVWLAIDEAQEFAPQGRAALSKELLIQWVKEGRQPGLSLMLATQQPDAVDRDLVSQCDLIICHRITANDDVSALNRLSHAYMGRELKIYLQQLKGAGEAVMLDDDAETVRIVKIRPRISKHGGAEG